MTVTTHFLFISPSLLFPTTSPLASNFGAFFCVLAENFGKNAIFRRFFARTAAPLLNRGKNLEEIWAVGDYGIDCRLKVFGIIDSPHFYLQARLVAATNKLIRSKLVVNVNGRTPGILIK